jgi:hypothetical protein
MHFRNIFSDILILLHIAHCEPHKFIWEGIAGAIAYQVNFIEMKKAVTAGHDLCYQMPFLVVISNFCQKCGLS